MRRSKLGRSALRRTGDASSSSSSGGGANVANWDITLVRYYFIDYDGGSDANTGYLDAAAGTVFTGAQLTNRAFKTWQHFFTLFPRVGAGRRVVILWKNRAAGATYLKIDGVTEDVVDFTGVSGYAYRLTRGSTDLTNSTTDRFRAGFITALAGPNVDGSFSMAAGATTSSFPIAAGTLTAEPGIIGWRVRFVGNVTPAILGNCVNILANTSTVITPGVSLGSAPGVGEQFFIEMPGCRVGQYLAGDASAGESTSAVSTSQPTVSPSGTFDVAAAVTSTTTVGFRMSGSGFHLCSGIEQLDTTSAVDASTQFQVADCFRASLRRQYTDEVAVNRGIGFSARVRGGWQIMRVFELECAECFAWVNTGGGIGALGARLQHVGLLGGNQSSRIFGSGSFFGSRMRFLGIGGQIYAGAGGSGGPVIGSGVGVPRSRSWNGIGLNTSVWLNGWQIENCTQGAVQIVNSEAMVGGVVKLDDLVGSTGNLADGITLSGNGPVKCTIEIGRTTACTVSGATGEIRSGSGVLIGYAALTRTNIVDEFGNDWVGSAGRIVDQCALVTNSSGGALAVGDVVRGNGTTGQVASSIADTLANSAVEGIMVTAPASGATGYMAPLGSGTPSVTCSAAPTPGAIVWLSTTTTRQGTTTKPILSGTQQLVQLGRAARVSGNNAQLTIIPLPENIFDERPIAAEISNAAASFSSSQTWLIAAGTFTADRAFTLEALSTLSVDTMRVASDLTSGGAFNILLTPNAADAIDGGVAGAAVAIPCGSRQTIRLRKTPTLGWKIV